MAAPDSLPPHFSTDSTPIGREREVDGLLRAAANLALVVLPAAVGEEVRAILVAAYNTHAAEHYRALARAILREARR